MDSDVPYSISEESISDLINRGDNQLKFGLKGEAMNSYLHAYHLAQDHHDEQSIQIIEDKFRTLKNSK